MNQDLAKNAFSIMVIMENITALKRKIKLAEADPDTYGKKRIIWEKELDNARKGLERKRCTR